MDTIEHWIIKHQDELTAISDKIWSYAELGLVEHKSAAIQAEYLKAHGFDIQMGVGGMDTAFVAEWSSEGTKRNSEGAKQSGYCKKSQDNPVRHICSRNGKERPELSELSHLPAEKRESDTVVIPPVKPVIGFLGEYDALPGVSNEPLPTKHPAKQGAHGHGCGHNLLGVASMAAAIALKEFAKARGASGTIRYYGCPAEESSFGKTWMVRDGFFDDVDIALTWHPGSINRTSNSTSLADLVYKFDFYGKTAHAAGDPWNGRSALDGVELMHAGIERMREHMRPESRVHYVITHGGGAPNVVPEYAQTFFDIRAGGLDELEKMYDWVHDIAQGAALMTQTKFEPRFLGAAANVIPNRVITGVFHQIMTELGAPEWTDEELDFASKMQDELGPDTLQSSLHRLGEEASLLRQTQVCDVVFPEEEGITQGKGSTDVGDVSWVVPTGQFNTACYVLGAPGHSWAVTACSGMSIGHKGMIFAAKVLGIAGTRFMTDENLRERARTEWKKRLDGKVYKTPVPSEIKRPPLPFGKNK